MSGLTRFVTLGDLVVDDGKCVYSDSWSSVYLAADVEQALQETVEVLRYHLRKHKESYTKGVTVDWSRATCLLARLEKK